MGKKDIDINKILGSEIFINLLNCDKIKVAELNAAIALLIKCNIGFECQFRPATSIQFGLVELKVFINPRTALTFFFEFDGCT